MNRKMTVKKVAGLLWGLLLLGTLGRGLAQTPQDNWYLEQSWTRTGGSYAATNGGLSAPYGVAIGTNGNIYVADQGYGRIQVYLSDGTYSFSITNGFGGGQTFIQPRGMITDKAGNLYVADYGNSCVYEFTSTGTYVRKFGSGTGSGNGQLSGVIDVAVATNGLVYVLENGNSRVSVFGSDGAFLKSLFSPGNLAGQLNSPASIAVSENEKIYISPNFINSIWGGGGPNFPSGIKVFDTNGVFLLTFDPAIAVAGCGCGNYFGACSIRFDRMGLLHVVTSWSGTVAGGGCEACFIGNGYDVSTKCKVYNPDGSLVNSYGVGFGIGTGQSVIWPCHAVGPDGTMIISSKSTLALKQCRYAMRDQWAPPRNAIPMPAVIGKHQRPNSPLVDIDYQVTDMDDTNVTVGILIFTNSSSSPILGNCLRNPTLIEGTSTNLGPGVSANQIHRLTWNAGADWSINLGNYRVAILARDSRTNLLDIHYLALPSAYGMPALKISRSPLNANDFMQVWWWLLATNDTGIRLSSNQIYGVSGAYSNKPLCTDGATTADGYSYLYGKMNLREATAQEVQWAKQGNMPPGSSPNQWTDLNSRPRQVSGRPKAVNEWGFDTGSWDTNTCKWVVPLN